MEQEKSDKAVAGREVLLDADGAPSATGCAPPSVANPNEGAHPRMPLSSSASELAGQILVGFCCVSPTLFGISIGFTSPTQSTMEGDKNGVVYPPGWLQAMSPSAYNWYASVINIGAVIGAFSGSFFSDRFGRQKTLVLSALPHLLGWLGTCFTNSVALFFIFRLLIGWGVGVGSAVTPVYIGEVATTQLRGALGAANQLSVTFGLFLVNVLGTYVFITDYDAQTFAQWRLICLFTAIYTLLLLVVAIMPESPKWLAKNNKLSEAEAALKRLRAGDFAIEKEQLSKDATQSDAVATQSASEKGIGQYRSSLVIGIGLCVFQQLSGVNAVMMFTSKICQSAGMSDVSAHQAAMGMMGFQVIMTGISCLLMERAGRRKLLIFAASAMCAANLIMSYYFLAGEHEGMWGPSWLALGALAVFITGFSLGMGPIPWLLLAEIFPTEVRSKASALATAANWGCSFFVTLSFQPLQDTITKKGTFFLFTIVCGLCLAFIMALVPETKGKTVEQVLAELRSSRTVAPTVARDVPLTA